MGLRKWNIIVQGVASFYGGGLSSRAEHHVLVIWGALRPYIATTFNAKEIKILQTGGQWTSALEMLSQFTKETVENFKVGAVWGN
jgi:hypothetical protein